MDRTELIKLIEKYNNGTCTEQEIRKLNEFSEEIQKYPYHQSKSFNEEEVKNRIFKKIRLRIFSEKNRKNFIYAFNKPVLNLAAALLLIFGLSGLSSYLFTSEPSLLEYSTGYNQQKTIVLSDGSKVYLNNLSSITYPETFSEIREVKLTGEAFFEVEKNLDKPFIVESSGVITKVLGTTFNIKAYENDENVEVSLVTGKVWVGKEIENPKTSEQHHEKIKETFILLPGNKAVLQKRNDSLYVKDTDLKEINAQRRGLLYFNQEPLYKVVKILNRYYNVDFDFADNGLKEYKISGEMRLDALANILTNLEFLTGLKFKQQNKGVLIQKPDLI